MRRERLLCCGGGFSKVPPAEDGDCGIYADPVIPTVWCHGAKPFESVEKAVQDGSDIASHTILVQHVVRRAS